MRTSELLCGAQDKLVTELRGQLEGAQAAKKEEEKKVKVTFCTHSRKYVQKISSVWQ